MMMYWVGGTFVSATCLNDQCTANHKNRVTMYTSSKFKIMVVFSVVTMAEIVTTMKLMFVAAVVPTLTMVIMVDVA